MRHSVVLHDGPLKGKYLATEDELEPNSLGQRVLMLSDKTNILDIHYYLMMPGESRFYFQFSEGWDECVCDSIHLDYFHNRQLLC